MSNPLDEKFLDGPMVGYCSDSDEEEIPPNFPGNDGNLPPPQPGNGGARTGPKGVLNDYELHKKELEGIKRERSRFIVEQAKRMTVAPTPKDADKEEGDNDDEESELRKLREQRLDRMRRMRSGHIKELTDKYEFLNVIEGGSEDEYIIIHIYRDDLEACKLLNEELLILSSDVRDCKWYKIKASILNTSDNFERNALPTLQIYLEGTIVANFIRITDEMPECFDSKHIYELIQKRNISMKLKSNE